MGGGRGGGRGGGKGREGNGREGNEYGDQTEQENTRGKKVRRA